MFGLLFIHIFFDVMTKKKSKDKKRLKYTIMEPENLITRHSVLVNIIRQTSALTLKAITLPILAHYFRIELRV
jgi:hypothetical protein